MVSPLKYNNTICFNFIDYSSLETDETHLRPSPIANDVTNLLEEVVYREWKHQNVNYHSCAFFLQMTANVSLFSNPITQEIIHGIE